MPHVSLAARFSHSQYLKPAQAQSAGRTNLMRTPVSDITLYRWDQVVYGPGERVPVEFVRKLIAKGVAESRDKGRKAQLLRPLTPEEMVAIVSEDDQPISEKMRNLFRRLVVRGYSCKPNHRFIEAYAAGDMATAEALELWRFEASRFAAGVTA